jgi:hypothetical protein
MFRAACTDSMGKIGKEFDAGIWKHLVAIKALLIVRFYAECRRLERMLETAMMVTP